MTTSAIVTGISGQDGAYLAENLLDRGYTVYGTYRRTSSVNFWRIDELGIANDPNLKLVEYDLTDMGSAIRLPVTSSSPKLGRGAPVSSAVALAPATTRLPPRPTQSRSIAHWSSDRQTAFGRISTRKRSSIAGVIA